MVASQGSRPTTSQESAGNTDKKLSNLRDWAEREKRMIYIALESPIPVDEIFKQDIKKRFQSELEELFEEHQQAIAEREVGN